MTPEQEHELALLEQLAASRAIHPQEQRPLERAIAAYRRELERAAQDRKESTT